MFDEFNGILCEDKKDNFIIIHKGMIREVIFYNLNYPNNEIFHRINDFNFKIKKLFKPLHDSNYKIEFDYIYLKTNKVEKITAYVKLNWFKYFIIKFTKGDYWITSKEVIIALLTSVFTIIIDRI